jgi:hypothetical protein
MLTSAWTQCLTADIELWDVSLGFYQYKSWLAFDLASDGEIPVGRVCTARVAEPPARELRPRLAAREKERAGLIERRLVRLTIASGHPPRATTYRDLKRFKQLQ